VKRIGNRCGIYKFVSLPKKTTKSSVGVMSEKTSSKTSINYSSYLVKSPSFPLVKNGEVGVDHKKNSLKDLLFLNSNNQCCNSIEGNTKEELVWLV
jgi:hypothetical protein